MGKALLIIDTSPTIDPRTGEVVKGFCVSANIEAKERGLVWGFARKKDAEIGMKALQKLSVDWSSSPQQIADELSRIGITDFEQLKKIACEDLQW